jgi:CRISPR-associated protein Csx17
MAGDAALAVDTALQRIRSAGLLPPLRGACADPATARLWAAALAFPISRACAQSMALYFEPTTHKENR